MYPETSFEFLDSNFLSENFGFLRAIILNYK